MKKIITTTLILFFLMSNYVRANDSYDECRKNPSPEFLEQLKKNNKGHKEGHYVYDFSKIDFENYKEINKNNVFTVYKDLLEVGDNNEFVLNKVSTETGDIKLEQYVQYHMGNLVEGTMLNFFLKGDKLVKTAAFIKHNLSNEKQVLSKEPILLSALNDYLKVKEYVLINQKEYPFQKVWTIDGLLAYKFSISVFNPSDTRVIYISPINNEILMDFSSVSYLVNEQTQDDCDCLTFLSTENIIVQTLLEGNQNITLDKCQDDNTGTPNFYKLFDELPYGEPIFGLDMINVFQNNISVLNYEPIEWCNEDIGNMTLSMKKEANAYYATEGYYNYLKDNYGIDSYDGQGSQILLKLHYPQSPMTLALSNTASWVNGENVLQLGDGKIGECNTMGTVEIIGHELTHAYLGSHYLLSTTIYTGNDANTPQYWSTKALHEGISDIIATIFKYNFGVSSNNLDWSFGDNSCSNHNELPRNLNDPITSKIPQAAYYEDGNAYWNTDPQKIYNRAGVITYWFYLMTEGGVGFYGYNVDPIGIDISESILFELLNLVRLDFLNLPPEERRLTFEQFRDYSIQATTDVYGECSAAHTSVARAWKAVGLMDCDDLDAVTIGIDETPGDDCTTLLTADVQGGSGCYEYTWYEETGGGFTPITNQAPFNELQAECGVTYKLKVNDVIFPECGDVEQIYSTTSILNLNILEGILLKIVPNPITDGNAIISIETDSYLNDASVVIFDITGKVIDELLMNSAIFNNQRLELNVTNLPSGVYFVHLSTSDGVLTSKFIKQ